MSTVGPELPPHLLAKRKRQQEEGDKNGETTGPGAKRVKSPSSSPKVTARQVGPAPPPAPLDERPAHPPEDSNDSDSSDDDGFGPALPTAQDRTAPSAFKDEEMERPAAKAAASAPKSQRDEWMTMPPTQDDLASRLDPSRPRPRGFNTGKGASAPLSSDASSWTETPEQKQKRLADQVMGITSKVSEPKGQESRALAKKEEEEARERAAQIKASRGRSLYDMHQKKEGEAKEDDPSQRAFDREKDMSLGEISGKQRREMLDKAAGFNSKFSGGSFL